MSDRYRSLIPRPVQARQSPGTFELTADTALVAAPGAETAAEAVRLLLAPLRLPLRPAASGTGLAVRLDPAITEPEGYRLRVTSGGIELAGREVAGVRHAAQALRQLLPDAAWRAVAPPGTRWVVPCGEVVDAPALAWRGGMLDVSRHFFAKDTLLRYVDLFAMHRLNRLHLHLTDDQGWRIGSRRYPRLAEVASHRPGTQVGRERESGRTDGTPHGGYYTLDDLAEITAYAAERGVTVVPEIDLPGHASALLAAYPELGVGRHAVRTGWGISTSVVKPVPATLRFVATLIEELCDAVPGGYLHLGGDECPLQGWRDDPEVADYQRSLGLAEPVQLFGHFLRELADLAAGQGRRMVAWDEAYVGGGLRPDSIVAAWRGDRVARRAAAAGYDVVRCPVFPMYFDYDQADHPDEPLAIGGPITLADVAAFAPVPADWTAPERARVLGAQFNTWTEYVPDPAHLDYLVFPRACAFAEVAWHGAPAAELAARLPSHLGRLDAAGCRYRPLSGPLPWQCGGTGDRRREAGTPIAAVRAGLEELSERADVPPDLLSMPGGPARPEDAGNLAAMSVFDVEINALSGGPANLGRYRGSAMLVVNVASQCGLTPQYAGLQALSEAYADRGLVVLGVPCNQFGGQEPGTEAEIAEFCETSYGVTFPMTEKVEVNGDGRHPLYQRLVDVADAEGHTGDIRWNFEKFLIAPDGSVAARFDPGTVPQSPELTAAIEMHLPR